MNNENNNLENLQSINNQPGSMEIPYDYIQNQGSVVNQVNTLQNQAPIQEQAPVIQNQTINNYAAARNTVLNTYNQSNINNTSMGYQIDVEQQLANSKDIVNINQPQVNKEPVIDNTNNQQYQSLNMQNQVINQQPIQGQMGYVQQPLVQPQIQVITQQPTNQIQNNIPDKTLLGNPNKNAESNFDKKMKKGVRKYNFLLYIIYLLIALALGYIGYNYWQSQNKFQVSKANFTIIKGSSYEEAVYVKGVLQDNSNYNWTSDNNNIATIDNGNIKALNTGTTTITVTKKKSKETQVITVNVVELEITEFTFNISNKSMEIGDMYTIIPSVNRQSDIVVNISWSSSNPNVAKVEKGVITAIGEGYADIIGTIEGTNHSAKVFVQVKK